MSLQDSIVLAKQIGDAFVSNYFSTHSLEVYLKLSRTMLNTTMKLLC